MKSFSPLAALTAFMFGTALTGHGMILYSGDNSANQTAPDNGAPWEQVGSTCGSEPSSNGNGTAIHVRGKYFLTANHVPISERSVTFDGETYSLIDQSFSPVQITTGTDSVDMKLCKLVDDPGLDDIVLNTNSMFDRSRSTTTVMIGYGMGRDPIQEDQTDTTRTWDWGSYPTIVKRWGTNEVEGAVSVANVPDYNYTYNGLAIYANNDAGDDEGALALSDSGSALFQYIGGQWVLSGLATLVQTSDSSTFGEYQTVEEETTFTGDANYFVRISSYASQIEAALPDLSTYTGWLTDNSLSGADAASTADADADGMTNLEEFAYGTNPVVADATLSPQTTLSGSSMILSWQQSTLPESVTIEVQETDDLLNTAFSASSLTPEQVGLDGDIAQMQVTLTPATGAQAFLRLSVTTSE
ncbi:MAG: hypothetical protein ACQKBW_00680 [Puniceicoccales bacterium]